MTVYFNSNALNNEYNKQVVSKMQTSMDRIQTQINTGKRYEHFYDLSFTETKNLLYKASAIKEGHQEVSILREGLYKINEMSAQLGQLQHILRDGLLSWQKKYGHDNRVTEEEMKKFANNILDNFETILNKRSDYDSTYLFSGEDVDIKPINIDEKNYYRGSKHNILFTYNEQEIELDFNAGDESISNMVSFLQKMKSGTENSGEVFDKLKNGVDQIIKSKRKVDLQSHDIKQHLDHEETLLVQNLDKYNAKMETNNISALTDLTRISGDLHAIYVSNKILLSTRLVDFL